MENSTLNELIHACMEIEKLSNISHDYGDLMDDISLLDEGVLEEFSFFINISEISQNIKTIKKYAVGVINSNNENHIRFDNVDHHNENPKVKEINPPHHKHIGKDEKVFGFSGKLEDMISDIEKSFLDMS